MSAKVTCPNCGAKISVQDSWIGHIIQCPKCHRDVECIPDEGSTSEEPVDVPSAPKGHREYKVITMEDGMLLGKFNPKKLEEELNFYARMGWRVVSSATADILALVGQPAREEIIIILERDI